MSRDMTAKHLKFLAALVEHGRLSAPTGNPPSMNLARRGLIAFVHRSEDLSVMEITDAGRAALAALTKTRTRPWGLCFYCDAKREVGPCLECGHRVWFTPAGRA